MRLQKTCVITTCLVCYLLLMCVIIPVTEIVIGSVYLEECNISSFIPVYLLVVGCVSLAAAGFALAGVIQNPNNVPQAHPMGYFLFSFLLACHIAGCVMTIPHSERVQHGNPDDPLYCHPRLYNFTFAVSMVNVCLWVLYLTLLLGGLARAVYAHVTQPHSALPQREFYI